MKINPVSNYNFKERFRRRYKTEEERNSEYRQCNMEGIVRGKDKGTDAYKFVKPDDKYKFWTLYADDRYGYDRAEVKAELAEATKSGKSRNEAIWDIAKWLEINLDVGFESLKCCE